MAMRVSPGRSVVGAVLERVLARRVAAAERRADVMRFRVEWRS